MEANDFLQAALQSSQAQRLELSQAVVKLLLDPLTILKIIVKMLLTLVCVYIYI